MVALFIFGYLLGYAAHTPATDTTSNSAAATTSSQATASTTPAAPKTWVQVAHFAGSGSLKSTPFTVGSQWRVHGINHGDSNFIVDYVSPTDAHNHNGIFNVIGNYDQVSQEYDAGTWYLDIEGDTWDITVENYQ